VTFPLRAGIARVPLPTPVGLRMMGYGARIGAATALHDPLFARALYLAGRSDCLLVVLDLCLLAPAQASALRERLAARTGMASGRIAIACTHTHSGPDTGLSETLNGRPSPDSVTLLLDAAQRAGEEAVAGAVPARLGAGRSESRIGRNRRRLDGPVDREVCILRVDRESGMPLAILYIHGCHPTVLGHDNLAYSADWPGAASRRIETEIPGALAIFALGAHGDIDPRTRGLQDVALEGRSIGVGFDEMERLGDEIGTAVAQAAAQITTTAVVEIGAAARSIRLLAHPGATSEAERRQHLAATRSAALRTLGLDPATRIRSQDLFRLAYDRTRTLPLDERRARVAEVRLALRDRQAAWYAGGLAADVEVQVLRLGPLWLLALPLEPTSDVGLDWKKRVGAICGGAPAGILSIANGWLRYLPHGRNFSDSSANQGYEVLTSTFQPDAAEKLLTAGEELAFAMQQET
jgi:neutral/alkaline ceramidase-like enzyme